MKKWRWLPIFPPVKLIAYMTSIIEGHRRARHAPRWMVVMRAAEDCFGLSQLIGAGGKASGQRDAQAYCFLLCPTR